MTYRALTIGPSDNLLSTLKNKLAQHDLPFE